MSSRLVWGRNQLFLCMLLCPNGPYTSLNRISQVDNRLYELTVLIDICRCGAQKTYVVYDEVRHTAEWSVSSDIVQKL